MFRVNREQPSGSGLIGLHDVVVEARILKVFGIGAFHEACHFLERMGSGRYREDVVLDIGLQAVLGSRREVMLARSHEW